MHPFVRFIEIKQRERAGAKHATPVVLLKLNIPISDEKQGDCPGAIASSHGDASGERIHCCSARRSVPDQKIELAEWSR